MKEYIEDMAGGQDVELLVVVGVGIIINVEADLIPILVASDPNIKVGSSSFCTREWPHSIILGILSRLH